MTPIDRLAINQITTKQWRLDEAVDAYARQGVFGIGLWRDKVSELGLARTKKLCDDAGMWIPTLCKTGVVSEGDEENATAALDDCKKAIDEAAEIGAASVVFVCGGMGTRHQNIDDARRRVEDVFTRACEYAARTPVRVGLEPFHPMHAASRGCINSLGQARDICARAGAGSAMLFDVFHCWWDPDVEKVIRSCDPGAFPSVQLCDWRVPTRDPVNDRAFMGEGAARPERFIGIFEECGYDGPYEIEIFSNDLWEQDPNQVTARCIEWFTKHGPKRT